MPSSATAPSASSGSTSTRSPGCGPASSTTARSFSSTDPGGYAVRKVLLIGFAGLALALAGCGGKTVINTKPMTDEEKRLSAEEDRKTADEESYGTAGKAKKGGKRP